MPEMANSFVFFSKSTAPQQRKAAKLISLAFSWQKATILYPLSANNCYQHPVLYQEHVPVTESQSGHKDIKSAVCFINDNLHQNVSIIFVKPTSAVVLFCVLQKHWTSSPVNQPKPSSCQTSTVLQLDILQPAQEPQLQEAVGAPPWPFSLWWLYPRGRQMRWRSG